MLDSLHQPWFRPLAAAVLVIIMVVLFRPAHAPLSHIAPPSALEESAPVPLVGELEAQITATPAPVAAPPAPTPTAEIVTTNLRLSARPDTYTPEQLAELAGPLETALAYVQDRTAMQLAAPVTVIIDRHPQACSLDGAADTEHHTIYLYVCPTTPTRRAVNILAHEFVHQLAQDHYGPVHLQADLLLAEGFATWGAGRYWLGNQPDFQHFVAANYRPALIPLATHYNDARGLDAMNRLYYEWGSFVEWLMTTKGRAAFDQLYTQGQNHRIATAPYQAVTGAKLDQLEVEWQAWLDQAN